MRRHQFERRSRHVNPDVHQHEIHRAINALERLAQVAFAQIDEAAQTRLPEIAPSPRGLCPASYSVPDHHACPAKPRCCRARLQRDRRVETPRRYRLQQPASALLPAAKLIAEFRLVAIRARTKLVAEKALNSPLRRLRSLGLSAHS